MVMNAVHTDPVQAVGKFSQIARDERRGDHDGIGSAEVERLQGSTVTGPGVAVEIGLDNVEQPFAQRGDRGELAHVQRGQAFGQTDFVAGGKRPVGKVVGKTFAYEMVFLKGAEGVLKNGSVGTGA